MSKSAESNVELNTSELKDFLKHVVNTNVELQKTGKYPVAVSVKGEAGLGKTSSIQQLAEEMDKDFVKLNLAQLDELGDLIGYPTRQFQMVKKVKGKDGNVKTIGKWVDESVLEDSRKEGYTSNGKDKMAYSLPEWVPTSDRGTVILFDDFSRAQARFIQATMEIINTQEYISWKLPKNCSIILSANPDNGDYHVQAEDTAQKTRYITVDLKFDVDTWAKWAEGVGIDSRC